MPDFLTCTHEYTVEAPTLSGSATVWQDLDFPIIVRNTGTGIPVLAALVGNITAPQWQVGDYNVCEGQELPHTWKQGSTVYWHLHLNWWNGRWRHDVVRYQLYPRDDLCRHRSDCHARWPDLAGVVAV